MHLRDAPVPENCDVDWREMHETGEPARVCERCAKRVHDLSAMDEGAARAVVASGSVCVRYLHDASGRIVRGAPPAGARVIPASALVSRRDRRRWIAFASIAASTVLFEACGGAGFDQYPRDAAAGDASLDEPRVPNDAHVGDAKDAADADPADAPADAADGG